MQNDPKLMINISFIGGCYDYCKRLPETFSKNPNGIPSKNPQLIFFKASGNSLVPRLQNSCHGRNRSFPGEHRKIRWKGKSDNGVTLMLTSKEVCFLTTCH